MTPHDEPYDRSFFTGQASGSLQSARVVLGRVWPWLNPRRVLDVGCGVGAWLRAARDLGAAEVVGVDGDYVDRAQLVIDEHAFIPADLAARSLRDALGERASSFDLVICVEVAEHLPHDRAPALVAELTSLGDVVLFSAGAPFQYGTHHINEQWPEYWAILFRAQGFACFDCLRSLLWADAGVDWWYAQNAMVFARDGSAAAAALPRESRADGRALAVVHPENLLANLLGLPRRHRQVAWSEEARDLRSLVAANLRLQAALPPLEAPARAQRSAPNARDVFPWTRTDIWQPERVIAGLSRDLAHARANAETAQARGQAQAAARMWAEYRLSKATEAEAGLREQLAAARGGEADHAAQAQPDAAALHGALAERAAALNALTHELAVMRNSPFWRVERRVRALARRLPGPVRDAVSLLARRGKPGEPAPSRGEPAPSELAAADSANDEPGRTAPPEDMPLIKRYEEVIGAVKWWTLAAAVTRLRRFELFDPEDYLRRNPEVAAASVDPYAHFLQSGALEGRGRFDPEELARLMSGFMLFENAVRALPPSPADDSDLPDLVADIGHIGIYVSSHGNVFMEDIAGDLAADLRSVGLRVDLLDENASIDARPPVCLFIAPHEFFMLGRGRLWVRADVFFEGFMFGTEQVQTSWFQLSLPFILMSRGMLDLCAQTASLFDRTHMASMHVLPGARMRPHTLTEADRRHPLFRALPEAARADPDPRRRFAERPIDLSFFGTSSPRRDRFFARNAAFLSEYETFNYVRNPERGPILSGGEDGVLTRLAGHVSGHSKITLNIHREAFGYFEWHRMVRLGMCSGSVVVSDPCLPDPSFVANEHYFQETTRHIPDLLEWLLTTEDGSREAERIRANVDELIANVFDTRRSVARTLRFLSRHRLREGAANQG